MVKANVKKTKKSMEITIQNQEGEFLEDNVQPLVEEDEKSHEHEESEKDRDGDSTHSEYDEDDVEEGEEMGKPSRVPFTPKNIKATFLEETPSNETPTTKPVQKRVTRTNAIGNVQTKLPQQNVNQTSSVTVGLLQTQQAVIMERVDLASVLACQAYIYKVRATSANISRASLIPKTLITYIRLLLKINKVLDTGNMEKWTDENFFKRLIKVLSSSNTTSLNSNVNEKCRTLKFSLLNVKRFTESMQVYHQNVLEIRDSVEMPLTPEIEKDCVKILINNISKGDGDVKMLTRLGNLMSAEGIPSTIDDYLEKLMTQIAHIHMCVTEVLQYSDVIINAKSYKRTIENTKYSNTSTSTSSVSGSQSYLNNNKTSYVKQNTREGACYGCGKPHPKHPCKLKGHPDYNKQNTPWHLSDVGIRWRERDNSVSSLPWNKTLSGNPWAAPPRPGDSGISSNPEKRAKHHHGENSMVENLNEYNSHHAIKHKDDTVTCTIYSINNIEKSLTVNC
jgi:hypothetical protein